MYMCGLHAISLSLASLTSHPRSPQSQHHWFLIYELTHWKESYGEINESYDRVWMNCCNASGAPWLHTAWPAKSYIISSVIAAHVLFERACKQWKSCVDSVLMKENMSNLLVMWDIFLKKLFIIDSPFPAPWRVYPSWETARVHLHALSWPSNDHIGRQLKVFLVQTDRQDVDYTHG